MRSTFKVLFYVNGSKEARELNLALDNIKAQLELTPDFIKEYEIYLSTDDIEISK